MLNLIERKTAGNGLARRVGEHLDRVLVEDRGTGFYLGIGIAGGEREEEAPRYCSD